MCTWPFAVVFWHPGCTCIKPQTSSAKVWIWTRSSRMLLFLQFSLLAFSGCAHGWTSGQIEMIKELGLSPAKLSMEAAEVSKMEVSTGCKNCANCHHCPKCWWCDVLGCGVNENCKHCHHCQHCVKDGFCGKDCNIPDLPLTRPTWGFDCKEDWKVWIHCQYCVQDSFCEKVIDASFPPCYIV